MFCELPQLLSVYVITYNRSEKLIETVKGLAASPLRRCNITIFDNCSTDDTQAEFEKNFSGLENFKCVRNSINIGLAANIMLPLIDSCTEYTWVLCDDDYLNLNHISDVVDALDSKNFDLIMVGGHDEKKRIGCGQSGTPQELIRCGVNYYRDTSFLPCTIYRTSFARKYVVNGYSYCHFVYPHMSYIFGAVNSEARVYVSQHRWVTASIGTQSYSTRQQLAWWFGLSGQLQNVQEKKSMLTSQWVGPLDRTGLYGAINTTIRMKQFTLTLILIRTFKIAVIVSIIRMLKNRFSGALQQS